MTSTTEHKVFEGVYMTDYRKKPAPQQQLPTQNNENSANESSRALDSDKPQSRSDAIAALESHFASSAELVQDEIARLRNSVAHLERSNAEMVEADASDPDFAAAIAENGEVIRRQNAKADDLQKELDKLLAVDIRKETAVPDAGVWL
eukprot:Opistho-2@72795